MGTGIWSMHFLAMLAFSLPIAISYNFFLVLISLLAAILAAGQALFIVSRPSVPFYGLLKGAISMGIGIAAMHYIGMFAMQMTATISYNPALFLLSVVIAVVTSMVALRFALKFSKQPSTANKMPIFISATVMGAAILLMHYTGMAAASFKQSDLSIERANTDNTGLVVMVTVVKFIVLTIGQLFSVEAAAKADYS